MTKFKRMEKGSTIHIATGGNDAHCGQDVSEFECVSLNDIYSSIKDGQLCLGVKYLKGDKQIYQRLKVASDTHSGDTFEFLSDTGIRIFALMIEESKDHNICGVCVSHLYKNRP